QNIPNTKYHILNTNHMDYREIQIAELEQKIQETRMLLEDPEMAPMAEEEIKSLEEQKAAIVETMQPATSENDLDERNAIVEVTGAAGGDEAKLWANELLRMYVRYCENHKVKVEQVDDSILKISGYGAFGTLKYEAGVHRVQRIPATEKKGRVHTS